MKANQLVPGMFLDLEGRTIPNNMTGGGCGRRHVPNWVRAVKPGRKWAYITLGDYRVWKVEMTEELTTRKPYCFCNRPVGKTVFFCPEHEGPEICPGCGSSKSRCDILYGEDVTRECGYVIITAEQMREEMGMHCEACETKPESHRCKKCNMTGREIADKRKA